MQGVKSICLVVLLTSGCASIPAMSPDARKVQVHIRPGPLVEKCKSIGPINVEGASMGGAETAFEIAKVKAREETARQGADTLAITNDELDGRALTPTVRLQGTALKCY